MWDGSEARGPVSLLPAPSCEPSILCRALLWHLNFLEGSNVLGMVLSSPSWVVRSAVRGKSLSRGVPLPALLCAVANWGLAMQLVREHHHLPLFLTRLCWT